MRDTWAFVGSAIIMAILTAISHRYNRWIDNQHLGRERSDGETALWVVFGVLYTLAAASGILSLWSHRLPHKRRWLFGPASFVAHLVTFVVAGLPMVWGDIGRTAALRQKQAIKDELRRHNEEQNRKLGG